MSAIAPRFGLGPIDQVSFAVTSIEQSLPCYEALFGGPFTVREVTLTPDAVTYRGAPADTALRLAFGSTAGTEIELVEVLRGEAPSLEHLREHGDGLHHVRFRVTDLEAKKEQLTAAGFEVIFDGTTPRGSFTYVEAPASLGHTVIELIQPALPGHHRAELAQDVDDSVRLVNAAPEAGQRDEPDRVHAGGTEVREPLSEVGGIAVHEQAVDELLRHGRRGRRPASGPPGGGRAVDRLLAGDGHGRGTVGRHRHVRRDLPAQPALGKSQIRPRLRPDIRHELEGATANRGARRPDHGHEPRGPLGRAEVHDHAIGGAGGGAQHLLAHGGHEDPHVGARLNSGQAEAARTSSCKADSTVVIATPGIDNI